MDFIDIHSHITLEPLAEQQAQVLARMQEKGVGTITVGVDFETSKEAVVLAEANTNMWATIGLHPTDNDKETFSLEKYLELADNPKVVAVGECGLDYFRSQDDAMKRRQRKLFELHIELAQKVGVPLMVHARPSKGSMDAYEDVIVILRAAPTAPRANFHFFVGNLDIAKQILELGGTMSFDGPITFARDYDEVIRYVPLESIHAETDAPFAAPVPYRGKTCEPWMVEEIVKKIAEIKELPFETVQKQLIQNAISFFNLALTA